MTARTQPRVVTLGFDASWTGTGWCLADQHGPIQCGHVGFGPPRKRARKSARNPNPPLLPTHRTAKLRAWLNGPMAWVLADAQLLRLPTDPLVRIAVEIPPVAFKAGKASAYIGVGRLVGAIELWATRPTLSYPWVQEPGDWRRWWSIAPSRRGRDSETLKSEAIHQVRARWGAEWLDGYRMGGTYRRKGAPVGCRSQKAGPRGDVAEAILLAVGSAQHADQAPGNPERWPEAPTGISYPT